MTQPRVQKRHHLIYYLEVYDLESGALLGRLVDITTRGIKIVGQIPIPLNKTFILKLILPEGYFPEQELHFEAVSQWSEPDVNPALIGTGFEVISLSLEERKMIRKLIEQIGFHD